MCASLYIYIYIYIYIYTGIIVYFMHQCITYNIYDIYYVLLRAPDAQLIAFAKEADIILLTTGGCNEYFDPVTYANGHTGDFFFFPLLFC